MKITMLGTGHALVTECYNTCFVLSENNRYFLVDAGGGNTILRQLKYVEINWKDIKERFVTGHSKRKMEYLKIKYPIKEKNEKN